MWAPRASSAWWSDPDRVAQLAMRAAWAAAQTAKESKERRREPRQRIAETIYYKHPKPERRESDLSRDSQHLKDQHQEGRWRDVRRFDGFCCSLGWRA